MWCLTDLARTVRPDRGAAGRWSTGLGHISSCVCECPCLQDTRSLHGRDISDYTFFSEIKHLGKSKYFFLKLVAAPLASRGSLFGG